MLNVDSIVFLEQAIFSGVSLMVRFLYLYCCIELFEERT